MDQKTWDMLKTAHDYLTSVLEKEDPKKAGPHYVLVVELEEKRQSAFDLPAVRAALFLAKYVGESPRGDPQSLWVRLVASREKTGLDEASLWQIRMDLEGKLRRLTDVFKIQPHVGLRVVLEDELDQLFPARPGSLDWREKLLKFGALWENVVWQGPQDENWFSAGQESLG